MVRKVQVACLLVMATSAVSVYLYVEIKSEGTVFSNRAMLLSERAMNALNWDRVRSFCEGAVGEAGLVTEAPSLVGTRSSGSVTKRTARVPQTYDAERSMRDRGRLTMERCSKRRSRDMIPAKTNRYIASMNNKSYAYHPIAKCGWTSWVHVMFNHVGRVSELENATFKWGWESPYEHAGMKKIYRLSQVKDYRERLLFVRDPYDRLVSAYKNKALNGPYTHWLRTPCRWLKVGMPNLTFPQFAQCIVDHARRRERIDLGSRKVAGILDIHWTPQYWASLPCDTNYTLIGKFNHLQEDMLGAVKILKLNSSASRFNEGVRYENESLGYWYNQLTDDVKQSLQQIYRLDFEIFGFNCTIPS